MNITISKQTAKRFVLGRQGLWPGRRWKGKKGTIDAIRTCEAVQLDPLNMVARSQDIVLHSRVLDYKPDYLYQVAYDDRKFFDYGGWLAMYPMTDLPYWRYHMNKRVKEEYVAYFVKGHKKLLKDIRSILRERGPLGNRDFDGKRVRGWSYRGRKETSVALFDMWLSGELMIHHREGFERVYDFRENIAPPEYDYIATSKETELFFAKNAVSFGGIFREAGMKSDLGYHMRRDYDRDEVGRKIEKWIKAAVFQRVNVEGSKDAFLINQEDIKALDLLERGKVPRSWNPKDTNTSEEVTFLAPLDIVSARGRSKKLFDFDYVWEVYKPLKDRRWGYYVLPILYGDDLVARLDPKLNRKTMTLEILGFWREDDAPVEDARFADALAKGLIRFAKFIDAKNIELEAIKPSALKSYLKKKIKKVFN